MKTRIAIWNLARHPKLSARRREGQLSRLATEQADLWILSETSTQALPPGHEARCTDWVGTYHVETECAASIVTRYPFGKSIKTFDSTFAVCAEVLHPQLGPIIVYASIIPYAGYKGPEGESKYWEEHRKSVVLHVEDWRRIREAHPSHHFIAGGDFNQSLDNSGWYGNRESEDNLRKGMADARLTCLTAENYREAKLIGRGNIDHILVSEVLASLCKTPARPWEDQSLSDHNGITIDLE